MKAAGWLALGAGTVLGFLAACFNPPLLSGLYQCDELGGCELPGYTCVGGVCCMADGGTPVCPPPTQNDGGEDAGCTVPMDPTCVYNQKLGMCRDGGISCATGTRTCNQVFFPRTEICNGIDDDCNGIDDDFPCRGGPKDFLVPSSEWVSGAMVASKDVLSQHDSCLLNDLDTTYTLSPGYLDGGNWRGRGAVTNFVYFQKADGGTWNLSPSGEVLTLALSGALFGGFPPPGSWTGYFHPIVYLCGPPSVPGAPEAWRRYNPTAQLTTSGFNFFVNTTSINLATGGPGWNAPQGSPSLSSIYRVEILLRPADPQDGGIPSFDAGITALGFSPF